MAGHLKVLILSSADSEPNISTNEKFISRIRDRMSKNVEIEWLNYHQINLEISTSGSVVRKTSDLSELKTYDFVFFKSTLRHSEFASIIARYLKMKNIDFACDEVIDHSTSTKLSQLDRIGQEGLSIPRTFYVTRASWHNQYSKLLDMFGEKFIFKAIDSFGGDQNYLVHSASEFKDALNSHEGVEFIAQEFLANDCDYRLLVLDNEVKLIIKRIGSVDTHLNNTSKGASAELINTSTFDQSVLDMAIKSANIIKRNISGVDILFELKSNTPYILEVNASPQIGSGAFMEEKVQIFSEFIERRVKNQEGSKIYED